jgi:hypothetical protein
MQVIDLQCGAEPQAIRNRFSNLEVRQACFVETAADV